MIVIEHAYDVRTGKTELREIERPDVISEAEAVKRPYGGRPLQDVAAELREQLLEHSLLGTEPDPALRAEYARLRAQLRTPT